MPGQRGSPSPIPASLASEAPKPFFFFLFFLRFAQILLPPTLVIPCPLHVRNAQCQREPGRRLRAPGARAGARRSRKSQPANSYLPSRPEKAEPEGWPCEPASCLAARKPADFVRAKNPHATLRARRCSFWAANTSLEPKPCYSLFPIHLCPPTSPETSTGSTQNNPPAHSRPPRDPHSCAAPGTPGAELSTGLGPPWGAVGVPGRTARMRSGLLFLGRQQEAEGTAEMFKSSFSGRKRFRGRLGLAGRM